MTTYNTAAPETNFDSSVIDTVIMFEDFYVFTSVINIFSFTNTLWFSVHSVV